MIKTKKYTYWKSRLLKEAKLYKSLKFMDKHLTFGNVHPLAKSTAYNIRDIQIGLVAFFKNADLSDCSI
jgi:hypothetical protein